MGFSFEILSEGSLMSLFGNPRFLFLLDWTGVHSACDPRSIHRYRISLGLWFDAR